MKLFGQQRRVSAWGDAPAGFGMLFYGITLMQTGFLSVSQQWQIPQLDGLSGLLVQGMVGVLMTMVMQSSSALAAVALSAAQAGVLDLTGAAAVVIGANIGTTITAVLACVGATPNAKRVAAAHVIFNVITAMVASLALPWLLLGVVSLRQWFEAGDSPALTLAIFNTTFNLLGVLILWPMANALTGFLLQRFKSRQDAGVKPAFLDQTTLPVPSMAARALAAELDRMFSMACVSLSDTVRATSMLSQKPDGATRDLAAKQHTKVSRQLDRQPNVRAHQSEQWTESSATLQDLTQLIRFSESFVDRMNRQAMDAATAERLAWLLRVRRYLENVVDGVGEIVSLPDDMVGLDALRTVYSQ